MPKLARLLAALAFLFAAAQPAVAQRPNARLAAIERASGGRLGVALIDAQGRTLLAHRAGERFAMCSTFKLLLGGMHAHTAGARLPLDFTRAELLPNSPHAEWALGGSDRGMMRIGFAAQAVVTLSDNTAANLLLRHMGGPEEFTRRLREMGDTVTRLDRYETALNENARGDPRDTTTPAAMARISARFVIAPLNQGDDRWTRQLRGWMTASRTGLNRIRAGLPAGWGVGDKTGNCGTAYNDVAFFRTPRGNEYVLAVYLDRPRAGTNADALIANVGRIAAGLAR